jgi:hypothetical protein
MVACWKVGSAEGDYALDWSEPATVTVNGVRFSYSPDMAGYVGDLYGNHSAPHDAFELVLDFQDPEVERPTPCGVDLVAKEARLCLCRRESEGEAAGELRGLCESNLTTPPVWRITAEGAQENGFASGAKLTVLDEAGEVVYENSTIDVHDLVSNEAIRFGFANVGLNVDGSDGLWAVALGAQRVNIELARDSATDSWSTSSDPGRRSFYEGGIAVGSGFLYFAFPGLAITYHRPLSLEQIAD